MAKRWFLIKRMKQNEAKYSKMLESLKMEVWSLDQLGKHVAFEVFETSKWQEREKNNL